MSTNSFIVFTGVAPHPPIMVPEVGGDAIVEVQKSIDAMAEFTHRIIESGAETVVIISPHAPLDERAFVFYGGPIIQGDFARFRAPQTSFSLEVDEPLISQLSSFTREDNFELIELENISLDHGVAVPLYFLLKNGWSGKVVALGYSFLSNDDHLRFGACIRKAVDETGRRVALIASGDLSHRLKPEAPAGYNPNAHLFDEEIVSAVESNDLLKVELVDDQLRRRAGECGYRSVLVAIGATKELTPRCELLSYEAPFGVGYMVAQFAADNEVLRELPALARKAIETMVHTGTAMKTPAIRFGILAERAACFVSIKTSDGELRGCIGTIEPTKDTLAEEIIANAIGAASYDPRFEPVTAKELDNLKYSVDVLSPAEPATMDQLDPKIYGVVVEELKGKRRGLLLPDIPEVTDAKQQVEIATRKAGIKPGTPVKLSRFEVRRFRE
ncbi:MAG TPA: AmmeMemoRadiSam system protein A [Pyrinomonadaceae bacterium]